VSALYLPIPASMATERASHPAGAHALIRAVAYLSAGLVIGVTLMAAWPQGGTCASSCNARIEAAAQTVFGLAAVGIAGFAAALWLGVRRRASAPRWLVATVTIALATAFVLVAVAARRGGADADSAGLEAARAARAWIPALPALALLVAESCAALGEGRRRRAAVLLGAAVAALSALLGAVALSAG
jgi:hypothetical protein